MARFGKRSLANLQTAHKDLQRVAHEVIKIYDHAVTTGHRGQEEQDRAVHEGRSRVRWPDGNHNATPSRAIDVAPSPIDWNSKHATKKFAFLAGLYFGIAARLGIRLRWGGDWDGDGRMDDQSFHDLPHIELL